MGVGAGIEGEMISELGVKVMEELSREKMQVE